MAFKAATKELVLLSIILTVSIQAKPRNYGRCTSYKNIVWQTSFPHGEWPGTCKAPGTSECPASYGGVIPVLIISLDAFRPDYIERGLTPTIKALAERGVTAPYMQAVIPTLTGPNHYSIVTGTYPEHHGIIDNSFYDPDFNDTFFLEGEEALEGRWWGAEPIWNTLSNQGKKTASFGWPGAASSIGGQYPTYYFPFMDGTPFEERIDQVLEWISLPEESRPSWISLYFPEPDLIGHAAGPDSEDLENQLVRQDSMVKRLVDGLESVGLASCVNMIVVSDHGMAPSGPDYVIRLSDYVPDIADTASVYPGTAVRIQPKDTSEEAKLHMMKKLSCQHSGLRVYEKEGLPTRFHYSNNRRIEDIVLDMDPGYRASISSDDFKNGDHGYENYFPQMNSLFIASGPAFKPRLKVEPFQNVELYNLMCLLAGVTPSPNNGTEGALYHVLANPPASPELPEEDVPPNLAILDGDLQLLLKSFSCKSEISFVEEQLDSLVLPTSEESQSLAYHLPWGVPLSGELPANLALLHHKDRVTAYSRLLRMPLWTSFTVNNVTPNTAPTHWSTDVLLPPETSRTCHDLESHLPQGYTMGPLFPLALSQNASQVSVSYLLSNAVPISHQLVDRWKWFTEDLVPGWLTSQGPLNIILGPIFDNDADSLVDDFTQFRISTNMPESSVPGCVTSS